MSRPKPGIGREIRRTLGHAKAHSSSSTTSAIQLAPVVSQYATASRSGPEHPASTDASASISASIGQLAHLSLIPTWDALDPLLTNKENIVVPYRPGRRLPLSLTQGSASRAASALLAPRPVRIGETLLRRAGQETHRTYTSSTAPVHHSAVDMQLPFPSLSIPPSLLADKFDSSSTLNGYTSHAHNHSTTWPFDFLWSHTPLEPESRLIPQQPPSPGPGTVKTREIPETHTVLSPSTPAPQQSSSPSQALLTQYNLSIPSYQGAHALPTPPDSQTVTTYTSSLEFSIGASGLAKSRPPPTPPRSPSSSSSSRERPPPPRSFPLPDVSTPAKLQSVQVGEDAYFTRPDSMCIADGVGGWARSARGGANAARWSRLLTHFIREEVDSWWKGDSVYTEPTSSKSGRKGKAQHWSDAWKAAKTKEDDTIGLEDGQRRRKLDAVEIMQRGFEKCLSCVMAEDIRGSSTCILALLYHSTLLLANLGDCALLLIRNGQVILRTSEMQHAFNHPLQVGTHSRDEPMKDAMSWQVAVEREDVVVLGSDGLMDNLYDEDILDVLATFAPPHCPSTSHNSNSKPALPTFDPQSVSEALCAKARQISEQTGAVTPFMERAIEEGIDFVGGKKDDITVIVGVVGQRTA